jgi:hypothetical protein
MVGQGENPPMGIHTKEKKKVSSVDPHRHTNWHSA